MLLRNFRRLVGALKILGINVDVSSPGVWMHLLWILLPTFWQMLTFQSR